MTTIDFSLKSEGLPITRFTSVCELLTTQAKRTPNAIAVIFGSSCLTYRELDLRSNQVAHYLKSCGAKPEILIGLSLSNSLDLIVGILAILKAGGVYLPLEASYPPERIAYMLEDAKPFILLTDSRTAHQFQNFPGKIIQLDQSWQEISTFKDSSLEVLIKPNHLAYVIYTSGSTGRPKGILVEHSSFAHGAVAHQEFYQQNLIGLLSSSISFDVSILIIFHSLISGGTIYIPPSELSIDVDKLIDLIESNSINYILCVPSLYSMILNKSRNLPSLKIVSLTGENIPNSITSLHSQFAPNAILYNEYGPTEYAIGTTIAKIYDPIEKKTYPISVGQPLRNTYVYILDENLHPVSQGTKGEIFIGGLGIARGYLNKPNLTAEKFIPFQSTVLYRTGDFGRFLSDGNMEFLGRLDHQVKIRGNRVELGEIEYAMCQYQKVNEAVVVVKEEDDENKRLVAYFTAVIQADIRKELKAHLTNLLPKYMIPSVFVQLKSFPLTPNGKIDRNALPNVNEEQKEDVEELQSELEQALTDIWKQVLHLKVVGNEDNFFDLGGDSLSIVKVQILIETALAIKISTTELLQYPTIFQLLEHLKQQTKNKINPLNQQLSDKKKAAFQRFKTRAKR